MRIAYDDLGSGEPALLLLTGWCSSRGRWGEVARLCSRHRRVLNLEWRGHGDSDAAEGDFGTAEMVEDALSVVERAGVETFVPCAASHAGWVAIELRRRLPERVPKLVHLDWMVVEPSDRYREVIRRLRSPETWADARDTLFRIWRAGVDRPEIDEVIAVMSRQSDEMWMRSGRVIDSAYELHGSPLAALSKLDPPPPALHLYGQPEDLEYLDAQQRFAGEQPWFGVRKLGARTHFAMAEEPEEVARAIEEFVSA